MIMNQPHTHAGDVVVALDGSPSGRAALVWAAAYARTTNARLQALRIVTYDSPTVWVAGVGKLDYTVSAESEEHARSEVQDIFDSIGPEPGWKLHFLDGWVGYELVRQSASARLLVVGTQEHTGLGRMLMGSVSHYCLSRAECPVVAVPAPVPPRRPAESVTSLEPRVPVIGRVPETMVPKTMVSANGMSSIP